MAEIAGQARLVMAGEARHAPPDRGPFGEAASPPGVVLGDRVELRQIEGQHLRPPDRAGRQGFGGFEIRAGAAEAADFLEHVGRGGRRARVQAECVAMAAVVDQRVLAGDAVEIAVDIVARVEAGRGVAALAEAVEQIMLERIDAGGRHVGVAGEIEGGVELRQRADLPRAPAVEKMGEQATPGLRRVLGRVPGEVEILRRRAALRLAGGDVVHHRIDAGTGNGGVGAQIPAGVEIAVRPAFLLPAACDEMGAGIGLAGAGVRVFLEVPGGVEQVGRGEHREIADDLRPRHLGAALAGVQAQRVAMATVVQQRVLAGHPVKVALDVEARVEHARWVALLVGAVEQIMRERIGPGGGHVGVAGEVEGGIEVRQRADQARQAAGEEMREQAAPGVRRMDGGIPGEVELLRRRTPLGLADGDVMQHRVHTGAGDVGVGGEIPGWIEVVIRPPPLLPATGDEMRRRVDAADRDIGVGPQIPAGIEQLGRRQQRQVIGDRAAECLADRPCLATGPQAAREQLVHRAGASMIPGTRSDAWRRTMTRLPIT